MQNPRLDETQAGIKIARRNTNNLRYADDSKWRGAKEPLDESETGEWKKTGLKLTIQKTKMMAPGPITSSQIDEKTMETVTNFIFLGFTITVDGDYSCEIKRRLLLGRKVMTNLDSIL